MKHLDGHVWGDRYWSAVLEEEPPEAGILADGSKREDCGEIGGEGSATEREGGGQIPEAGPRSGPPDGDSHCEGETAKKIHFPPLSPRHSAT
jgi:hypothetical protein